MCTHGNYFVFDITPGGKMSQMVKLDTLLSQ